MRIIAGRFRGRSLAAPASDAIRPTSDRLREAIFNVLAHAPDASLDGARVIDLFAGTGALGIEAMSRGAAFALFVDESSEARSLIRTNLDALGLGGATRVFRRDATRLGVAVPIEPFSLVFCDPPYGRDLTGPALASLAAGGWLKPGALLVLEERRDAIAGLPPRYAEEDRRSYGETEIVFARYK